MISEGWATLEELETWYSLDDVLKANDMLDSIAEAKREAETRARKGSR